MSDFIIYSAEELQRTIGELRTKYAQYKYLRVNIKAGKDRSLDANAVTHVWYGQIARERGDVTEAEVKCECKLHYGVPILRTDDPEFREMYDRVIKDRTYEEKLQIMKYLPVTSLMTTPQMNLYRDTMQAAFDEQGICLVYKEDQSTLPLVS